MASQRRVRFGLDILNMKGEVLSSIDERIVDGQVNVAADADGPTRSMSVTLYDPENRLRLDSDSPMAGSLALNRMLRAWYGVFVPSVGWVDIPVFTGPIVGVARNGHELQVECQGKEAIALQPVWRNITVEKGVKKTDAIRRIMRERAGEMHFDIPDLPTRLGASATLTPQEPEKRVKFNANTPWGLVKQIAASMDRQVFYDGRARLRVRRLPGDKVFTFDESVVQTEPQVKYDTTNLRNAIKVTGKLLHEGKEDKGPQIKKHQVSGEAEAPDNHPLSPGKEGLGWVMPDGSEFRRRFSEFVTNDAIRSDLEATRAAKRILKDRLVQQVDITFDALPIPHLEEMDMVLVAYEDMRLNIRLKQFSIPLTHAGTMSVGSLKRVTKPRRR